MTTSVRLCLSYYPLKWDFVAFKMNSVSIRKHIVGMTLSVTLRVHAKVLLHVWSYAFYDASSFEKQRHHMMNCFIGVKVR